MKNDNESRSAAERLGMWINELRYVVEDLRSGAVKPGCEAMAVEAVYRELDSAIFDLALEGRESKAGR